MGCLHSITENTTNNRFALHVRAPLDLTPIAETCFNASDGQVIAQGFGDAPWDYTWYDEMGNTIREMTGMMTADTAEDLAPGFYQVVVTNQSEQCNTASGFVQVTAAQQASMDVTVSADHCNATGDGSLFLFGHEDYVWNVEVIHSQSQEIITLEGITGDSLITELSHGLYTINANNNCDNLIVIEDIDLSDVNAVVADFEASSTNISLNDDGVVMFFNTSSDNVTQALWDFGDGTAESLEFNPVHTFLSAGIYDVKMTASNGTCEDSTTTTVTVTGINPGSGTGLLEDMTSLSSEEIVNKLDFETIASDGFLKISSSQPLDVPVDITLFSAEGKLVLQHTSSDFPAEGIKLNIGHLPAGYFILIVSSYEVQLINDSFIKH
ncbi:MAG: PKD domain-containing protein [Flavobacteriales bacterium]|nr:PKD domain-containing protein [Flavobacteriales bacterium]